jgi:hypothetical protein
MAGKYSSVIIGRVAGVLHSMLLGPIRSEIAAGPSGDSDFRQRATHSTLALPP